MASEIRVNKIANRAGLSTVEYTDTGIIVSGIVTCTEISGINALNIAGVSTFASPLDINGDIDVDGHTNLDNLSVAGVSTFSNIVNVGNNIQFTSSSGNISGTTAVFDDFLNVGSNIKLGNAGVVTATSYRGDGSQLTGISVGGSSGIDFDDDSKVRFGDSNELTLFFENAGNRAKFGTTISVPLDILTANTQRIVVEASGHVRPATNNNYDLGTGGDRWRTIYATTMNATTFVGNGDFVELDVDGHTNLDNVSIAGVVTATSYIGDGSSLSNLPAGAPVGGASTNTVFFENDKAVAVNYQITSTKNAMSAGPIAINAGIAVTVPSGCAWTIV